MADMMEYKCPSCGGAMEFDSTTQKMKCPYCDTEMEVAQYQQMQEKAEGNAGGNQGGDAGGNNENWSDMGNNQWMEGETDGIRVYVCQSCEERSLQMPIPAQQAVRSVETGLS